MFSSPTFLVKATIFWRNTQIQRPWFIASPSSVPYGTRHSGMIGEVIVMEPTEFQTWLASGQAEGSLSSEGGKLFADFACNTCHRPDAQGRAPVLEGLFGKTVRLQDGGTVVVDEAYLRESIVNPAGRITMGFQPVMPTYQGVVTEEQLLQLIEYIKALTGGEVR